MGELRRCCCFPLYRVLAKVADPQAYLSPHLSASRLPGLSFWRLVSERCDKATAFVLLCLLFPLAVPC